MSVKPPAKITSKSLAAAFLPHLVLFTLLVTLFHYNKTSSSFGTTTSTHPSSSSTNIDSPSQQPPKQQQPPIPPIESLLAPNGTIIGDISWMLDFAIIAFPKSGTTFMKDYLRQSSEVWMYPREFCIKSLEDVERFVRVYYEVRWEHSQQLQQQQQQQQQENHPDNASMIQYGLKCPGVLYRNDIELYRRYFTRTKLIVGIRHPISWFESFYNYQMYRNVSTAQMKMMTTTDFVGRCEKHQKVCTDRARFHAALARLGFTRMEGAEELGLLFGWRYENQTNRNHQQRRRRRRIVGQDHGVRRLTQRTGVYPSSNQVFMYEIRQIHNSITSKQLSKNIQQYLEIDKALPEISSYAQNKTRAINICDDEHKAVRRVLVEHGKDAADWIENYFVKSSNVVVSSPESFFDLLNDWRQDPCEENSVD